MIKLILLCLCFRSSLAIVGGNEIDITKAPYQVYLSMTEGRTCGGVIISARTILTTARCLSDYVTFINVRAGTSLMGSGGVGVPVQNFTRHPKHNRANNNFDVALVYTLEPIKFGPTVQPIPLSSDRLCTNTDVETSGWGRTAAGSSLSNTLRSVTLQIASVKLCQKIFAWHVGDGLLCVVSMTDNNGPCTGDEGGPLVMNGKLIGVLSYVKECGAAGVPISYVHIPAVRKWIVQNMQ